HPLVPGVAARGGFPRRVRQEARDLGIPVHLEKVREVRFFEKAHPQAGGLDGRRSLEGHDPPSMRLLQPMLLGVSRFQANITRSRASPMARSLEKFQSSQCAV